MSDYGTSYGTTTTAGAGIGAGMIIFYLIICVFVLVTMWKLYAKAGKPGWAAIVPIYNIIVLIQIAGLPLWYFLLMLIPVVNIYAIFKIYIELAHKFGQSTGFGALCVFFGIICLPILAFGSSKYVGTESTVTAAN